MTRQLHSHIEQLLPHCQQCLPVRPGLFTGGCCLPLRAGCMQASCGQLICELSRDAALVFLQRPQQLCGTALGKARRAAVLLRLPLGGRLPSPRLNQVPPHLCKAARRTVGRRLRGRPPALRVQLGCAPAVLLAAQAAAGADELDPLAENSAVQIAGMLSDSGCAGALHGSFLPLQGGCTLEAGRLPHCMLEGTVDDLEALLNGAPRCLSRKPHIVSTGWTETCGVLQQSEARPANRIVTHHIACTMVQDEPVH